MISKDLRLPWIISTILAFLATGCIPIDDLAGYWDKGIIDVIGQYKGGLRNEGDGP